jgi:fatty-acyl-CoA synthase
MAALVPREGAALDLAAFARFLDAEPDLSPKWVPTFLRVARDLKRTETHKIVKRELQREGFFVDRINDPLYWRERGDREYRRFTSSDLQRLLEQFLRAGTEGRLNFR